MDDEKNLLAKINIYGIGRRKLDDELFINDKPPPRLGVYNFDEENLCHEVIKSTCNIPGCSFASESLLEFENHYNATHRYACGQCKKNLPSPHLLDLHIQETHDSFFAVMAKKKPSYCCYIEECKEKFNNPDERMNHCIREHNLPRDFRFESKAKIKNKKPKSMKMPTVKVDAMELDIDNSNRIAFTNSKQKTFNKYTGRQFPIINHDSKQRAVNMEDIISDLKDSLPK